MKIGFPEYLSSRYAHERSQKAMSLVEVALAIGIVSFCLISLTGLFPVMLDSIRESRETALKTRIYQTVAEDLRDRCPTNNNERVYRFDEEGSLISIQEDGSTTNMPFSTNNMRYQVVATSANAAAPLSSATTNLIMTTISITNDVRKTKALSRVIWSVPPAS